MKTEGEKIRVRMLVPLAALLVVLLAVSVTSICWIQRRHTESDAASRLLGTQQLFRSLLDHEAKFINGQIDFLKPDPAIRSAWLERDRTRLLSRAAPLFESIRSKYRVTHFYFTEPDKTCFLRVQDPGRYGDKKKLFTLERAIADGEPCYGIELGKLGTFTLRVIHPWMIDGNLVGYMELGMEIEHLTPRLKEAVGADLFFVIDKEYLTRAKWEAGLKMMGRSGNWDHFSDHALIDSTMETIPAEIGEHLKSHGGVEYTNLFRIRADKHIYFGGCVPLVDAGDRKVGDIIVLTDITQARASVIILSVSLIALGVLVGGMLLVFFHYYIGRIGRRLIENQNELSEEIDHRREVEEELRESNSMMEVRIQERTTELEKANDMLQIEIAENVNAQKKLNETMDDLKRFNKLAVGRELRMAELKDEINELCCQLGLQPKYRSGDEFSNGNPEEAQVFSSMMKPQADDDED